jgi:ubiquinone/menaquinone biosynthesis C-methylase UbiE
LGRARGIGSSKADLPERVFAIKMRISFRKTTETILLPEGCEGPITVSDETVRGYYERFPEERRLSTGVSQLEAARTKALIRRFAPQPPSAVLDVGGGAGAYAFWLANQGYEVHLMDLSTRLVELATDRNKKAGHPLASVGEGDARALPIADGYLDAVLLLGPLYHLTRVEERAQALAEAARVLKPGGVLFAACLTRWASLFDGLVHRRFSNPAFGTMASEDVATGQHRNPGLHPDWFTTAYMHRPDEFAEELRSTGLEVVGIFGLEGPAVLLPDFDERWADPTEREAMIGVAETVESEPALHGVSPHLPGVCRA